MGSTSSSPQAVGLYRYRRLRSPRSIRLLEFLASVQVGHDPAPCRIKLKEVSLDSSYEEIRWIAVSYVWGSSSLTHHVWCDGLKIPVTANAAEALAGLSYLQQLGIFIWIDSVCIDQTSLEERGQQVALMGDIYRRSKCTFIWLGHDSDVCRHALRFCKEAANLYSVEDQTMKSLGAIARKVRAADHQLVGKTASHFLLEPLMHPWFTRLWMVQEFAVANRCAFLHGGGTIVNVDDFRTGLDRLSKEIAFERTYEEAQRDFRLAQFEILQYQCRQWADINRGNDRRESGYLTRSALQLARQQACFDPKDKVFGIYSILELTGLILPRPDYSKSVRDIYIETTLAIIEQEKSLRIFELLGHQRCLKDLPSWVADFTVHVSADDYLIPTESQFQDQLVDAGFLAAPEAASTKSITVSKDQSQITLQGHCIGYITDVLRLPEYRNFVPGQGEFRSNFAILLFWSRVLEMAEGLGPVQSWDKTLSVLRKTIFFRQPSGVLPTEEELVALLQQVRQTGLPILISLKHARVRHDFFSLTDIDALPEHVVSDVLDVAYEGLQVEEAVQYINADWLPQIAHDPLTWKVKDHSFFTTDTSLMGMAYSGVRKGDMVVIFEGARIPMILSKSEKDKFEILGPAAVEAAMKAPMPDTEPWDYIIV